MDQKARRAIEAIRGFYEDRIVDSRALADFNARAKELDDAEKLLNDLDGISPGDAHKVLVKLQEQEKAAIRPRRPPTDKVKRRLRELLSAQEIKKKTAKFDQATHQEIAIHFDTLAYGAICSKNYDSTVKPIATTG